MRSASNHAVAISQTVNTLVLLRATEVRPARSAIKYATSSAATQDARRSAANHVLRVLRRDVRPAASMLDVPCRAPLPAIGFRALSGARNCWIAITSALLSAALNVRVKDTVRSVLLMTSKTFELISLCLPPTPRSTFPKPHAYFYHVATFSQLKVWTESWPCLITTSWTPRLVCRLLSKHIPRRIHTKKSRLVQTVEAHCDLCPVTAAL